MKRQNLAASVKAAAAPVPAAEAPAPAPVMARMPAPSNDGEAAPKRKRAATRENRKSVYAFMDPAEHQRLKLLSVTTGKSIDTLVGDAVRLLFAQQDAQN